MEGKLPAPVSKAILTVRGLADGTYQVTWWNTQTGQEIDTDRMDAKAGSLQVPVPTFSADIACKIEDSD
jgi:hypothetical protein